MSPVVYITVLITAWGLVASALLVAVTYSLSRAWHAGAGSRRAADAQQLRRQICAAFAEVMPGLLPAALIEAYGRADQALIEGYVAPSIAPAGQPWRPPGAAYDRELLLSDELVGGAR
jgi:hypothetical protein